MLMIPTGLYTIVAFAGKCLTVRQWDIALHAKRHKQPKQSHSFIRTQFIVLAAAQILCSISVM